VSSAESSVPSSSGTSRTGQRQQEAGYPGGGPDRPTDPDASLLCLLASASRRADAFFAAPRADIRYGGSANMKVCTLETLQNIALDFLTVIFHI
jgi:hypothetical protein